MAHRIPFGLALIFCLTGLCALPLTGQHSFTISIPGIEAASERPVVQTPDGGFVLLFSKILYHIDRDNEQVQTDSSFIGLAKLSADGLVEWSRSIKIGEENITPVSLHQLPDGGFIVLADMMERNGHTSAVARLQFNAHGYLTGANQYESEFYWQVDDGMMLENGNLGIAASANSTEKRSSEAVIMILTPEGEIVRSDLYPALSDPFGKPIVALRSIDAETIALVGSMRDSISRLNAGVVALLDLEGTIREGIAIDPYVYDNFYYNKFSISDILPNKEDGYVLYGYNSAYMCMATDYYQRIVACTANWDTLWTRECFNTTSVFSDQLLPTGEQGFRVIGQTDPLREDPYYMIEALNTAGRLENALRISQLQLEGSITESDKETGWIEMQSEYLELDDHSILIVGSRCTHEYNSAGNPLPLQQSVVLSRLSPDLMPCSGEVQSLHIDKDGLTVLNHEEEPPTAEGEVTPSTAEASEELLSPEADIPEDTREGEPYTESSEQELSEYGTEEEEADERDEEYSNEGNGLEEEETEEEEKPHPFIRRIDLQPTPLNVTIHTITDFKTVDIALEPTIHCQENAPSLSSVTRQSTTSDASVSAAILLSPNSLQAGDDCELTFSLVGKENPDISILNVATGQVVRQVAQKAVTWSFDGAAGRGWARLETAGLAAGIYLVRVRSGERQLTAKLEIR